MPDCRRGVGSNCNCREELVKLLMSRLTPDELERLDREHSDVMLDSIAEAAERAKR